MADAVIARTGGQKATPAADNPSNVPATREGTRLPSGWWILFGAVAGVTLWALIVVWLMKAFSA